MGRFFKLSFGPFFRAPFLSLFRLILMPRGPSGGLPGPILGPFWGSPGRGFRRLPEGPPGPAGVVPGITADLRYLISGVPLGYGDLRSSLNNNKNKGGTRALPHAQSLGNQGCTRT